MLAVLYYNESKKSFNILYSHRKKSFKEVENKLYIKFDFTLRLLSSRGLPCLCLLYNRGMRRSWCYVSVPCNLLHGIVMAGMT